MSRRGPAPAALVGVLLAAGRGRRLGGRKQLLPWRTADGEKPLVAAAFDAVAGACDSMLVVVGHEADAVIEALAGRIFDVVRGAPNAEMMDSIRAGLVAVSSRHPGASILLQPADHPGVSPATISALLEIHLAHPDRAVMPEHEGRGGHPVIIPPDVVDRVLAARIEGGLRRYWLDHAEQCKRVAVDDPAVIRDVDTPADLLGGEWGEGG